MTETQAELLIRVPNRLRAGHSRTLDFEWLINGHPHNKLSTIEWLHWFQQHDTQREQLAVAGLEAYNPGDLTVPILQSWKKFGESIQRSPSITLAAYLGDEKSIETADQHGIDFPTLKDLKRDRHLNPNSHKLDLTKKYVEGNRLLMTILLWGKEPVFRAVNALSLLQLAHQPQCEARLLEIRNQAAFALQRFVDDRSETNRSMLGEQLRRCRKPYEHHEQRPDSVDAELVWYHLGAPWFALETVFDGWKGQSDIENEHPIPQAHSTYCHRNSVWAKRTMDAAAHWSSDELAQATVKSVLIRWTTSCKFSILP